MAERKTRRLLDASKLTGLLPIAPELTITLNISAETNYSSYVESVGTNAFGGISGGGTKTSTFESYYFGFGVENTSNIWKRVQFEIHEVDADNYIVGKSYIWDDIAPGTRRRLWIERSNHKSIDFKKWQINKIGVASTPEGGKSAKVPDFDVESSPKISIYELFSLSKKPLEPKRMGCCGCLVILVIGAFLLMIFALMIVHNFDMEVVLNDLKSDLIRLVNWVGPIGNRLFKAALDSI